MHSSLELPRFAENIDFTDVLRRELHYAVSNSTYYSFLAIIPGADRISRAGAQRPLCIGVFIAQSAPQIRLNERFREAALRS